MTNDQNNKTINTSGGDVAGRDIDKRQGEVFVENSTIVGNVIGKQIVQLPSSPPALHQLRAPVSDFVGREQEIDQLIQALTSGAAATISGVRGMGGIGKTELAYIIADRLKDTFLDAQIVVELRGASSNPLTPEQALQMVIRAFGQDVKPDHDLSQLQGIYRSVLTGKRAIILADDAKDAAQVRPLIPPPGCALLVTSRNRFSLPGMVALDLGMLPPDEPEKLLLEICLRIGQHAPELAKLCGYLPLALRVSASLLQENDSRDVAHYLEQLRSERLTHLTDPDNHNDPQASVEASLQLSYDALEPIAQSVLCQMSVFPTSFDLVAMKFVVKVEEEDVVRLLEQVRRRSLVECDIKAQHYKLHDLVRAFALPRLENAEPVYEHFARYEELRDLAKSLGQGLCIINTSMVRYNLSFITPILRRAEKYGTAHQYLAFLWRPPRSAN